MKITALIPVKGFRNAKQRLSPLLNGLERELLAETMVRDVLRQMMITRGLAETFVVTGNDKVAEIAAARLMTPWFGASTVIWANTIATVLVALSVGYAVGGRLPDRDRRLGHLRQRRADHAAGGRSRHHQRQRQSLSLRDQRDRADRTATVSRDCAWRSVLCRIRRCRGADRSGFGPHRRECADRSHARWPHRYAA